MKTDKTGLFAEYDVNKCGRDFVCGDIHGCYSYLQNELKGLSFDESKDRLFLVGDLADRGPESKRALEFIKKPWFIPVLGNHEEMFIQCWIEKTEPIEWHCHNGGDWARGLSSSEKTDYGNELKKLPIINRVGNVLICHSLLPHQKLELIVENIERIREFILWQRDINYFGGPDGFITYAGHTINEYPTRYGNVIDIDTGAFLKYWNREGKLTVIEINKSQTK